MNQLLKMLTGGTLQSDGRANEAADEVIKNPRLLNQLIDGLSEPDDLIRGRTAHALEKISRGYPQLLIGLLPLFIKIAVKDSVPMVRWHIAMIFSNLPLTKDKLNPVVSVLIKMLDDESVFVKSWAIVSLVIIASKNKTLHKKVIPKVKLYQADKSIAIRTKVVKALQVLEDNKPIPAGWMKAR